MTFRDFLKEEMTSGDIATITAKLGDMKRNPMRDKKMCKCTNKEKCKCTKDSNEQN